MKTRLIVFLAAPVFFAGVAVISMSWFLARTNERIVQDLTRRCVEHGSIASSSLEPGLLSSKVKFSCAAKAGSGTGVTPIEGTSEAK